MLYEKKIQLKPSSNCRVVKVKTDRVCAECGSKVPKGSSCYTLNPRGMGRHWVCFSCIPAPDVEEARGMGTDTQLVLFSEDTDSWGRHKQFGELTSEGVDGFYDNREKAIWASIKE